MEIYKIIAKTDLDNGIIFKGFKVECEEKKKTYKTISNEFIKKEKMLVIDTIFYNNYHPIQYHTWCLPSDIQKAKEDLKKEIIEKIKVLNEKANEIKIIANKL